MVWDAGLGTGAVLRLGLDPVALLRWSPCGAYLFAGEAAHRAAPPRPPCRRRLGGLPAAARRPSARVGPLFLRGRPAAAAAGRRPTLESALPAPSHPPAPLSPRLFPSAAAGQGGRFHVAETSRWRTASWDSPPGTAVAAAAWAPLGRTLVLAFAGGGAGDGGAAEGGADAGGGGGGGVVALHLVGSPPSLVEQVLPVTLPEVTSLDRCAPKRLRRAQGGHRLPCTRSARLPQSCRVRPRRTPGPRPSRRERAPRACRPDSALPTQRPLLPRSRNPRLPGGPLPRAGVVADLAWDPSGRRLAVLLRAPHPAAGLVALYSTTLAPLLHAELIGFARPLAATAPADADGDEIMGDDGGSGQGGAPPPAAALAFAQRLAKGGAVLSVAGRGRSGELVVSNIALAI